MAARKTSLFVWSLSSRVSYSYNILGQICRGSTHTFNAFSTGYARSERSERSAQLLAFKRENFVYSRAKNSHFSCVHFEVAASPTEKTSLIHVSIFNHIEIVEIIGQNTREIISSVSFACWTTDNFQAPLKRIFSWVCFLPFACKHRSRTVRNPFYIDF